MRKRILALLLILLLVLSGCGAQEAPQTDGGAQQDGTQQDNDTQHKQETDVSDTDMFTSRDRDAGYDEGSAAVITLHGSTASCPSNAVRIDGTTVTITDEGTYILTGTLDDGQIIVNADKNDKLHLVLRDAAVHSSTSAALYVLQCDKAVVTLEGDNALSSGESFAAIDENNIDGAVYAKEDLTFNGTGSLAVTAPAGHGIVCKDDLVFTGGSYTVASAGHGLDANDSIRISGAEFSVQTGQDGFHAENNDDASLGFVYVESGSFIVEAEGDGLSAGADLTLLGGSYRITAGGGSENAAVKSSDNWGGFPGGGGMMGSGGTGRPGGKGGAGGVSFSSAQTSGSAEDSTSMKGIKSGASLTVSGGSYTLDTADDALHANGNVTVSGGIFDLSSGDDGIHADETLTVSDGTVTVNESYEGLEGLHITVSGGVIRLTCSDDGINAAGGTDQSGTGGRDQFGGMPGMSSGNGSITISGGDIYMNASGDGIDANGTLEMSGGYVVVCGPTQGDTAVLDYDKTATITGGTFIGTGSTMMAQTFSDSTQGVFAVTVGSQSAGTQIVLTDAKGNVVIDYTPVLPFGLVVLSSETMVKGENYTITVGEASGTFTAN